MAAYLREHPDADVVYSDEDKLLADGTLGAPTFKPDFSPDRLLAENYINHFTVVRRTRCRRVGGFREGFDGSQDHDLMLRVTENAAHVGHVPDVLYAWRMVPGSTAVSAGFKPLAQDAGRRAVADALGRRGIEGRVDLGPSPGLYIPRYAIAGAPSVDVVVVARTHGRRRDGLHRGAGAGLHVSSTGGSRLSSPATTRRPRSTPPSVQCMAIMSCCSTRRHA